MSAMRTWPPERGETVLALSGRVLGRVGRVDEDAFELLTDGSAVWLTDVCIYTVEASGVTLLCEQEGLHQYVIPRRSRDSRAS